MTGDERLRAELTSWMRAEPTPAEMSYLDATFERTRALPQRKAWTFPARWLPWLPEAGSPARTLVRLVAVAALLLLLAAAAIVGAGAVRDAWGDAATGGGWRLLANGDRYVDFHLDAHSNADGSNARGTYLFRTADVAFRAEVTCLRVLGSLAVIGGRITETEHLGPSFGLLLWVSDGDVPAGGQPGPDRVTFSLVSPDDPLWPLPGVDVPTECPSTDLPAGVDWKAVEGSINVLDR